MGGRSNSCYLSVMSANQTSPSEGQEPTAAEWSQLIVLITHL